MAGASGFSNWNGAVSKRRIKSKSKSPEKVSTTTRSPVRTPFVETQSPAKRALGHSKMIETLNEELSYLTTTYTPPRVPTPRAQLPVGFNASTTLSRRNEIASPQSHNGKGRFSEEVRQQKRLNSKKIEMWSKKKDDEYQSVRTKRATARKKKEDLKKAKAEKAVLAYEQWVDCKRRAEKRQASIPKGSTKTSRFKGTLPYIDEMIAAARRCQVPLDVMSILETLLPLLDGKRKLKVHGEKFMDLINQASLQDDVELEITKIKEEEELNPLPTNPKDLTPDQRQQKQRDALRQRIGEQILSRHCSTRRSFVTYLKRIDSVCGEEDDDMTGFLKEGKLKDCMKKLDLGISATNQVELIKAIREKGADTIEYSRLKRFLITAEANRQSREDYVAKDTEAYTLISHLCAADGTSETRDLFEALYQDAVEYRKLVNSGEGGWMNVKDFKKAINSVPDGLNMSKRKDLHKALDSVCRLADRDKDGVIEITDVDLFLRMLEKDLEKNHAASRVPAQTRRRTEICNRYMKIAISNFGKSGGRFEALYDMLTNAFDAQEISHRANPFLSSSEFITSVRGMNIGLSMVQVEELSRVLMQQNDGLGIDPLHIVSGFREAKIKIDNDAVRKQDPRSALSNDIFRSLGQTPKELPDILMDYQAILMTWDAPEEQEAEEIDPDEAVASLALTSDNQFDVSWGQQSDGAPISMPPGSAASVTNDLNVVQNQTSSQSRPSRGRRGSWSDGRRGSIDGRPPSVIG